MIKYLMSEYVSSYFQDHWKDLLGQVWIQGLSWQFIEAYDGTAYLGKISAL